MNELSDTQAKTEEGTSRKAPSSSTAHNRLLLDDFLSVRDDLSAYRELITAKIKQTIDKSHIPVVAVESRIKDFASLEGKLQRKGGKYADLSDITDLLGLRIITYYTKNVDSVCALLERLFEIDWPNSQDKRTLLSLDKIGYLSIHYICYISDLGDEGTKKLSKRGFRFEIQVRTLLQHMWAQTQHDIFYKSAVEVPKKYARPINLLAGLLEMADNQFSDIVDGIEEYRRRVKRLIKNGNFASLELDGETFRNYLELRPFDDLIQRIARINTMEIVETNLDKYVKNFVAAGCRTIEDVDNFRKKYSEAAYNLAVRQFSLTDLDIISSSIAVNLLFKAAEKMRGNEE